MLTCRMTTKAPGSVKESPADCEIGDWVLATGSNIEADWLEKGDRSASEIDLKYEGIPDRHDRFRRAEKFGDFGDVWVRIA